MTVDDLPDHSKFRDITPEELIRAKIGERYWGVTLNEIPNECEHRHKLEKWISRIDHYLRQGIGLHVFGESGTGRSSVGAICAKATIAAGKSSLYMTAFSLRRVFSDKNEFDENVDLATRIKEVDLLVIDDAERGHDTQWSKTVFEELIKTRVSRKKAIVFIARSMPKDLDMLFGTEIGGSIKESCIPLECKGVNFRQVIIDKLSKEL